MGGLRLLLVLIMMSLVPVSVYTRSANICGYNGIDFICCYGWQRDAQGECVVPHCPQGCGPYGKCIRPDTCLCPNGYVAYTCTGDHLPADAVGTAPSQPSGDDPDVYSGALAASRRSCSQDCNARGECVEGVCKCNAGYEGPACEVATRGSCFLAVQRGLCVNAIDSLLLTREECCGAFRVAWGNPCQRCTPTYCSQGYKFIDRQCVDIDECQFPGICTGGMCRNTMGSFECSCPNNYQYEVESGKCIFKPDICRKQPGICGEGGTCVDKADGSYSCRCHQGYVAGQGTDKKCVPRSMYTFNMCQFYKGLVCENGKCLPHGASYMCHCNPGYVESADRKSCNRVINICASNSGLLCANGQCVPQGGDFFCRCNPGFSPSSDNKQCLSSCDMNPALCPNGRCIPLGASYVCECLSGYLLSDDRRACLPDNSWANNRNRRVNSVKSSLTGTQNDDAQNGVPLPLTDTSDGFCSLELYKKRCRGGDCVERPGSYQCRCLSGFVLSPSGMSCDSVEDPLGNGHQNDGAKSSSPMSFCERFGPNLCLHGHCVTSGSAYQCVCNSGFRGSADGKSCIDINECTEVSPSVCGSGTCINTLGGFTCSCALGYTLQEVAGRKTCLDFDECASLSNLCPNGACRNVPGSYECDCPPGFEVNSLGSSKECIASSISSNVTAVPTSPFVRNVENCSECRFGCENVTQTVTPSVVPCACPRNSTHIKDSGVCGNLHHVRKVSVDLEPSPQLLRRRRRNAIPITFPSPITPDLLHPHTNSKNEMKEELTFEMEEHGDIDAFVATLYEENVHVKKDSCSWLHLLGDTYVYCTFIHVL